MRATILLLALVAACGHGPASTPEPDRAPDAEPLDVTLAVAEEVQMPSVIALTGTLVADQEAQVPADVAGVVTEVRFELGDRVKKGQILATLDTRTSAAQASASAAQASAQEAQLAVALLDCARADKLLAEGAMTRAQHERAVAGCDAQRQATRAAQAASTAASSAVDRAHVRAPFDGIVGERLVDVGTFVSGPQPIAALYSDGPLRVRLLVPEAQAPQVSVGARVRVSPSSTPGVVLTGTVEAVGGALRSRSRDLVVEAVLDEVDARLRPGMFSSVELEGAPGPVVAVPEAAIRVDGTARRLFVVREGRAFEIVPRTGAAREGRIAVLVDVAAGDTVVVDPPAGLVDGRRVE